MKNLFVSMCMVAFSTIVMGQEKINSYTMSFFDTSPTFDISATEDNGEYKYYISMFSLEGERSPVVLMIDKPEKMKSLVDNLGDALSTYVEWDSISVANNVTDLNKELSIKSEKFESAFIYGSSWNFDYVVRLSYTFKHMDDGKPVLIVRTGELQSGSNQYIDSDGGVFVFSSEDEIEEFIDSLDRRHVENYFNKKQNTESLFED